MESIKPDSTPPVETISQRSFNNMNQKDEFQGLKNMERVEFNFQNNRTDDLPWIIDGVAFPKGTEFRGKYKGYYYYGKVNSGALIINGKKFSSPSAAALSITRSSVDGWLFWDCKPPGMSSWMNIHTLKHMK